MKRLPLLSLSLVAVSLGVGCSSSSQENASAPTPEIQVKRRTQALSAVTLSEVEPGAEVLAAAGGNATVRAFVIESAEGEYTADDVRAAALQQGASDSLNLPWEPSPAMDREDARASLRYLDTLLPAIEASVGTDEEYSTGYFHWFLPQAQDTCGHGDLYVPVFTGARKVFVIEATGTTEC
jgi:hypothetical protein